MSKGMLRMWHRRMRGKDLALATFGVLLVLLSYLSLHHLNMDPTHAEVVRLEHVQLQGFEHAQDRIRSSGNSSTSMHLLTGDAAFARGGEYVFSLNVDTVPGAPAQLVVDLHAGGYDNLEQEKHFQLLPGQRGLRLVGRFNARQAPDRAAFRIFYSGPDGLVLRDVRVARLPSWRVHLELVIVALGLLACGFWCWCLASWLDDPGPSEGKVAVSALLFAIAFVGCIRFLLQAWLPYWSGDEFVYKSIALGIWDAGRSGIPGPSQILNDTNLPNMLYVYWIAPAFAFGEGFYAAIRAINAATMAIGVIPLFLIAKRFMPDRRALFAAIGGLALPSAFLGSFAVTEALYFPVFLFACNFLLGMMEKPSSWRMALLFGLCLGVLLNVRLNGIILVPAVVACTLIAQRCDGKLWLRRPNWLLSLMVAGATWFALRHLLSDARPEELGLYRNRSGGWVSTAIRMALNEPAGAIKLLLGHLTLLALPFGPVIAMVVALPWMRMENLGASHRRNAAIALLLIIALSVAMAIVFTLGVAPQDIGGLGRWHSRYYFAALPLLIVLTLVNTQGWHWQRAARFSYFCGFFGLMFCSVVFVLVLKLAIDPWFGSTVDSMEAHWYKVSAWVFPWLLAATLSAGLLVLIGRRDAYIAVVVAWLILANYATFQTLAHAAPGVDDPQCGKLASQLIARSPGSVAIVVSDRESLVDNLFWLPFLPREARHVEPGSEIEASSFPDDDYLLSDPQVTIKGAELIEHTGSCRIYRANGND